MFCTNAATDDIHIIFFCDLIHNLPEIYMQIYHEKLECNDAYVCINVYIYIYVYPVHL